MNRQKEPLPKTYTIHAHDHNFVRLKSHKWQKDVRKQNEPYKLIFIRNLSKNNC